MIDYLYIMDIRLSNDIHPLFYSLNSIRIVFVLVGHISVCLLNLPVSILSLCALILNCVMAFRFSTLVSVKYVSYSIFLFEELIGPSLLPPSLPDIDKVVDTICLQYTSKLDLILFLNFVIRDFAWTTWYSHIIS